MFHSPQPRFQLFQIINENNISFEWTKMTVQSDSQVIQIAQGIKKSSFFNRQLVQLNFYKNWLQIFRVFKWGFQAGAGTTVYYNNQKSFFIPMYVGSVLSLQITQKPFIIPFISAGYSMWSIGFHTLSSVLSHWSAGALISFAIMKSSLGYTLLDEYGIHDMGIIVRTSSCYSVKDWLPQGDVLAASLHIGAYFRF